MDICSNCKSFFEENSIQYLARLKKNGPKLCRDCNRINKAEERAKKRSAPKGAIDRRIVMYINKLKKNNEKICNLVLCRKFKLTLDEAERIVRSLNCLP